MAKKTTAKKQVAAGKPRKEVAVGNQGGAIKTYDINKPQYLTQMSLTVKTHIRAHKLSTQIAGKDYAHVDAWQFAGGLLNIYPEITKVENMSTDKEIKWYAECVLYNSKREMCGFGAALCSNLEQKKKSFDEYAILSMAQTRAEGKAFRNKIGFIMNMAGYEVTPREEMKGEADKKQEKKEPDTTVQYSAVVQKARDLLNKNLKTDKERLEFVNQILPEDLKDLDDMDDEQAQSISIAILTAKK